MEKSNGHYEVSGMLNGSDMGNFRKTTDIYGELRLEVTDWIIKYTVYY